jgi:site-specific recombinase XerD
MKMLEQLFRQLESKNRAKNTFVSLEQALGKAEENLGKPLEELTWEELLTYFESLKEGGLSISSVYLIQSKFIQFYKFCFDETEDSKYYSMFKKVKKYQVDKPKKHISPSDLLIPEDVKKLINVATLERDRCIVSSFWESGMRVGEMHALPNDKVSMNEQTQEVTFDIPDVEGCKTGCRTIVCTEIYGYVQDWMKCNTSEMFMPMSENGIRRMSERLFNKAGIKKPCNVHIFRHSAIAHWVNIGMQPNAISMRAWGIPNSNMLSTYISLSEQMQATAYKNAKGMNGDGTKVINTIACRCVERGRLIQSGNLCVSCKANAELKVKVSGADNHLLKLEEENEWLKSNLINMKNMMSDYEQELRVLKDGLISTAKDKKLIIEKK